MAFVPAVLMTAGVAVLSLWEAPQLPPPVLSLGDKVLHGLLYTVLAITWAFPILKSQIINHKSQIIRSIYVVACVTAYGGLMELLQHCCTRTRSGEWLDVLADFIGAIIGVILCYLLHNYVITSSPNLNSEV